MKNFFLIAEIGINHNGSLSIAKKLIENAKSAGFDAVKFQKRDINLVYKKEFLDSFRESPWGKTQRKQKEGLELNDKQYDEIDTYCKQLNIGWDRDLTRKSVQRLFNIMRISPLSRKATK